MTNKQKIIAVIAAVLGAVFAFVHEAREVITSAVCK